MGHTAAAPSGLAELARCLPESAIGLVTGPGATSVALALLGERQHDHAAAIGLPHLGLEAAAEYGVALERFVVVPAPGPAWAEATALALEACGCVLAAPCTACTEAMARRLAARVRERRGLLLLLSSPAGAAFAWPGVRDVVLECAAPRWSGLAGGPGRFEARELLVDLHGHRAPGGGGWQLSLPGRAGVRARRLDAVETLVARAG